MTGKRIVFCTLGSLGDLYPILALAREMKRRGHSPALPPLLFIATWSKPRTSGFIRFARTFLPTTRRSCDALWIGTREAVTLFAT